MNDLTTNTPGLAEALVRYMEDIADLADKRELSAIKGKGPPESMKAVHQAMRETMLLPLRAVAGRGSDGLNDECQVVCTFGFVLWSIGNNFAEQGRKIMDEAFNSRIAQIRQENQQ